MELKPKPKLEPRSAVGGKWLYMHHRLFKELKSEKKTHLLVVYGSLAMHADSKSQQCWPSQETIAEETGICRRSVQSAIKELRARRIIGIRRSYSKHKTKNTYLLTNPRHWLLHRAYPAPPQAHTVRPNKNQINNKESPSLNELRNKTASKMRLPLVADVL